MHKNFSTYMNLLDQLQTQSFKEEAIGLEPLRALLIVPKYAF